MKSFHSLVAALLLLGSSATVRAASDPRTPRYAVDELKVSGAVQAYSGTAGCINERGDVVGFRYRRENSRSWFEAVIWRNQDVAVLPSLGGMNSFAIIETSASLVAQP